MFFLDHAWLVPLIPAVSFVVILLFGKKFPKRGSEVGIVALGASWVLALGALIQWIHHLDDANGREGRGRHGQGVRVELAARGDEQRASTSRRSSRSSTRSPGSRAAASSSTSASRSTASP